MRSPIAPWGAAAAVACGVLLIPATGQAEGSYPGSAASPSRAHQSPISQRSAPAIHQTPRTDAASARAADRDGQRQQQAEARENQRRGQGLGIHEEQDREPGTGNREQSEVD